MDPDPNIVPLVSIGLCLLLTVGVSAVDALLATVGWPRIQAAASAKVPPPVYSPPPVSSFVHLHHTLIILTLLHTTILLAASWSMIFITVEQPLVVRGFAVALVLIGLLLVRKAVHTWLTARHDLDAIAALLARPLSAAFTLVLPLVWLFYPPARPYETSSPDDEDAPAANAWESRLRVLLDGERQAIEPATEPSRATTDLQTMLARVMDFHETIARDVVVPRVYMVALTADTSTEAALAAVRQSGHSRIPVYDETLDNIVGILHTRDLLSACAHGEIERDEQIQSLLRPAFFVPESLRVDALLKELQSSRVQMAIVVDEYGGTTGLVTMEDLLEEMVGTIQDEYDVEEPTVQLLSAHEAIVDARAPLDELAACLALDLDLQEHDRIGSLLYAQLGRPPQVGETIELDTLTITVLTMSGTRPDKLQIARIGLTPEQLRDEAPHTQLAPCASSSQAVTDRQPEPAASATSSKWVLQPAVVTSSGQGLPPQSSM